MLLTCGAGGETSYDLTVEETTFGVAAPTDLYFCAEGTDVRSYTLSTVASDAACTKLPGKANPVCNSATSDVPCPVCTTALAATGGFCTPASRLAGGWQARTTMAPALARLALAAAPTRRSPLPPASTTTSSGSGRPM